MRVTTVGPWNPNSLLVCYLSIWAFVRVSGLDRRNHRGRTVLRYEYRVLIRLEHGSVVVYVVHDQQKTLSDEISVSQMTVRQGQHQRIFVFRLHRHKSIQINITRNAANDERTAIVRYLAVQFDFQINVSFTSAEIFHSDHFIARLSDAKYQFVAVGVDTANTVYETSWKQKPNAFGTDTM